MVLALREVARPQGAPQREAPVRITAHPADLKAYAIQKYGGSCFLCGETDSYLLGITHPMTNKCGIHKYRFLRGLGWPKGGRVVCSTCTGSLVRRI